MSIPIQYGWFNNTVNGEKLAAESRKSRGFTGSVEAGYTFKAGEFIGSGVATMTGIFSRSPRSRG